MPSADRLIQQTEQRLAEVEALQATMQQAQLELNAYRELLARKLALLRTGEPASGAQTDAEDILMAEDIPEAGAIIGDDPEPTPTLAKSVEERRTAPRRRGNPVSVQVSNATANVEPFQGWVIDRSSGGLCLLVDQQVKPGLVLSVRPTKCHPSFPWVQVRVRSCRAERNSWNLGCQFEQKMTWTELQLFG